MTLRRAAMLFLVACGSTPTPGTAPKTTEPKAQGTAALITEVVLDTYNGLSGLATDSTGKLWTIPERAHVAYRIDLDAALAPTIEKFDIVDLPPAHDLESIEVPSPGKFAFGTEGRGDNSATVMLGEQRGNQIVITSTIRFTSEQIGLTLSNNHGAEGLCGQGNTLLVAIEQTGIHEGKRWAPLLRVTDGALVRRHRLWLTTPSGKLSGLDCTIAPDGTMRVWALERHYEIARILEFDLPAPGDGDEDITPRLALDLQPDIRPKTNLEGIAHLPDGRVVVVNDNQFAGVHGPNLLFVLRPDALQSRK